MKSKTQKRTEALTRLQKTKYNDSKAKRRGTATEAQWQKHKDEMITHLKSMPVGY